MRFFPLFFPSNPPSYRFAHVGSANLATNWLHLC
jgi:hypothetical protein